MALQAGLVGLPNVGKSTLFNALLSRQVADAANYPFCTIEPNVGVVEIPDPRLGKLAEVVHSNTLVPAAMEFVDIAGLVEGASQGEGLGNKFLSHIREVDAIIYVLRDFSDENIVRAGSKSPSDDLAILTTELQLADLQTLEKQREPKSNPTKEEKFRWSAVEKIRPILEAGRNASEANLTEEEQKEVKSFALLTMKPAMIVLNTDEEHISDSLPLGLSYPAIRLCAKLEAQLTDITPEEKNELLSAYGIEQPGLNILIQEAFRLLHLITFLTAGEKEVRAWPILEGTKAPQAAGTIHTDFEKAFIKANIASFTDFVELGGWKDVRNAGKARMEGKEYIMQEGDVVEFMVNP
ncbi:redox-regulated ATPase YchF [candidate division WWE3 bacterium]|nr:redox-regulated ATPase YchF [candidate division WWE3 bacterium]